MKVISTSPLGVVNNETIFVFNQTNDHIQAQYSGGKIRIGFLVGYNKNNQVQFSFCQQQNDGTLDHGHSVCELGVASNKKIRMIEKFEWRDGEKGENTFEEI